MSIRSLPKRLDRSGSCDHDGCGEPIRARRLCNRHYHQWAYAVRKAAEKPNVNSCVACGITFVPTRRDTRYCTIQCREQARIKRKRERRSVGRVTRCLWCQADIAGMRADAKYCSTGCAKRWYYEHNGAEILERSRLWIAENRERKSEAGRQYRTRNRGLVYARQRRWQQANLSRHRSYAAAYGSRWKAANKHKVVAYFHNRRERIRNNPGSIGVSPRDWERMLRRYRGCAYCHTSTVPLQMEHVIPVARGGRHAIGNVVPACAKCNQQKNGSLLIEWRYRHRSNLGGFRAARGA